MKKNSEKRLPVLSADRLTQFQQFLGKNPNADSTLSKSDSINQSFLMPTRYFNFKKKAQTISGIKISGNVVLLSDTLITIDSTAKLSNIMIFAKSVVVKSGFQGNCQIFATDSISVGGNTRFEYPSCLGVLRFENPGIKASQEKISLGKSSDFSGTIFTYEKSETALKPLIDLASQVKITGQVYSQGALRTKDSVEIDGSAFTSQFLYQNSFTLFQNYLINIAINSKKLSPYYLSGDLLPVAGKKKKILQWLETK